MKREIHVYGLASWVLIILAGVGLVTVCKIVWAALQP